MPSNPFKSVQLEKKIFRNLISEVSRYVDKPVYTLEAVTIYEQGCAEVRKIGGGCKKVFGKFSESLKIFKKLGG